MSATFAPKGAICILSLKPTKYGPTSVPPPNSWSILVDMLALWIAGIINKFAGPVNLQKG